jgi:hypothetical protein
MKTDRNKKFDLKKFEVAKLKNMHLINGGNINKDDVATVTDTQPIVIKVGR